MLLPLWLSETLMLSEKKSLPIDWWHPFLDARCISKQCVAPFGWTCTQYTVSWYYLHFFIWCEIVQIYTNKHQIKKNRREYLPWCKHDLAIWPSLFRLERIYRLWIRNDEKKDNIKIFYDTLLNQCQRKELCKNPWTMVTGHHSPVIPARAGTTIEVVESHGISNHEFSASHCGYQLDHSVTVAANAQILHDVDRHPGGQGHEPECYS